ncbi:MAG: glycosyl transferase [Acidobacteriota bacterium]
MEYLTTNFLLVLAASFVAGIAMTLLTRSVAWRLDFVAKPKSDRWHKRPTAMLGGVAIFVTTIVIYLLLVPHTRESIILIGGSSILFIVGLVDDLLTIRPYQKLIGQLIGAILLVQLGLVLPLTGIEILDYSITVFWMIGITNAVNLLDNMDGLAVGISTIAAISLGISFAVNGQTNELLLIAAFVGALLGFLVFNFNPASIFMGDCGSLFVGFFLGGSVLLNQTGGRSRGMVPILAVPVLILLVPIFDTTFVTLIRKLWGRSVSQGGRDHTSHRLVALGLSERSAVLMLYVFAIAAGALSLVVRRVELTESLALILIFTIVLVIIGVYLSKVRVYDETDEELAANNNAVFAFLVNFSHKRRIFEVFLDVALIALAYYTSFFLIFGPFEATVNWDLFLKSLPLLILFKLVAFLAVGMYRGLWRYTSVGDLVTFAKGVVLGSILSVLAILVLYRFVDYSRAVFVVDGMILLILLIGSRMAFRLIRIVIPQRSSDDSRNALIYGAGDGGEMILRELKNNPEWRYTPVGFVDDDPLKAGKVIHGLTVYAGNGSLPDLCRKKEISEILISVREFPPERLRTLRSMCRELDVTLKRARMTIEPVDFE